ncbi:MAG: hypothetical protein N3A69_08145 [Leptospiraceae bacterium]|nr:hypothetical protein [Leptospiraceae bacterium]
MQILLLIILLSFPYCISSKENLTSKNEVTVTLGAIYNLSKANIQEKDKQEILSLLQKLVDMTLEKSFLELPNYVDPELGIYPDLKAHWNYLKLKEEVRNPNSYFETFFFNKDKLMKEKNSPNVLTVRDVILLSEGIRADLFFESNTECEVKLIFNKAPKHQGDLNNPYFIKRGNLWKVYRLF